MNEIARGIQKVPISKGQREKVCGPEWVEGCSLVN